MTESDLAYVAGYLDGEGCFVLAGRSNIPCIMCSNTHRPTIEWLQESFGGKFRVDPRRRSLRHRLTFCWTLTGSPAADLCERLLPYLREKKDQALLLMERARMPKFQGQRSIPLAEVDARQRLKVRLHDLKGRIP